jgi:hypothetical protein
VENDLEEIKRELTDIRKSLEKIEKRYQDEIPNLLQRRGYLCLRSNPKEGLILPRPCDSDTEDVFYELMKRYSFRIFLRDVLKRKRAFEVKELLQYCSEETVNNYITALLKAGIVEPHPSEGYRLCADRVTGFGDTLEWFVAKVFENEFYSPSSYGISISNTKSGGDFDVISFVEGNFLYVEVKSSPPKHVDVKEISSFLDRVEELQPDFSIFFEDTELRLKDKIVPMFQDELERRYGREDAAINSFPDREDDWFQVGENLFIINSKPDIIVSIGKTLKTFLKNKSPVRLRIKSTC